MGQNGWTCNMREDTFTGIKNSIRCFWIIHTSKVVQQLTYFRLYVWYIIFHAVFVPFLLIVLCFRTVDGPSAGCKVSLELFTSTVLMFLLVLHYCLMGVVSLCLMVAGGCLVQVWLWFRWLSFPLLLGTSTGWSILEL